MASTVAAETLAFLHARGIRVEPRGLAKMLREALERLPTALYSGDARAQLTPQEAEALERGGLDLAAGDLGEEDPLARAVTRYTALLETGLSTSEAAERLGVDSSRVRQRLTAKPPTLYGVRLSDGSWRIPEFQFGGGRLLPGVEQVVSRLDPELHPVAVERWFTTPDPDLLVESPAAPPELAGKTLSPREWLLHGLPPAAVAELAEHL